MTTFQRQLILWRPVIGVSVMQGAIALMWVVYNLYLPKLLYDLKLAENLGLVLLTIEGFLGAILEPLAGTMNDRLLRRMGIQFPLILGGATVGAFLFAVLPWVALWGLDSPVWRGIFIFGILLWAAAMAMFRAPLFALTGRYAENPQLPQASSALMLAGAIVQLFSTPSQRQLVLSLSPYGAFGISAGVLLVSAGVLQAIGPLQSLSKSTPKKPSQGMDLKRIGMLIVMGLAIGMSLMLLRRLLQPKPTVELGLSIFLAGNLLAMLPAGWVATQVGNVRCLFWGLVATIACTVVMSSPMAILWHVAWLGLGVSASFVMNAVIPLALAQATANRAGFAMGAYFGGASIAMAIVNLVSTLLNPVDPSLLLGGTIVSLLGAIAGLYWLYPEPWRSKV